MCAKTCFSIKDENGEYIFHKCICMTYIVKNEDEYKDEDEYEDEDDYYDDNNDLAFENEINQDDSFMDGQLSKDVITKVEETINNIKKLSHYSHLCGGNYEDNLSEWEEILETCIKYPNSYITLV
jgi:hypothetical protein